MQNFQKAHAESGYLQRRYAGQVQSGTVGTRREGSNGSEGMRSAVSERTGTTTSAARFHAIASRNAANGRLHPNCGAHLQRGRAGRVQPGSEGTRWAVSVRFRGLKRYRLRRGRVAALTCFAKRARSRLARRSAGVAVSAVTASASAAALLRCRRGVDMLDSGGGAEAGVSRGATLLRERRAMPNSVAALAGGSAGGRPDSISVLTVTFSSC
ncbi:hypothetical protein T492DRAFT_834553 [Pavlovales sp. CCMP2436]|nr:hypothetical protein T492DRAFT_834553 [Pavlovales sp. CCMP2436]